MSRSPALKLNVADRLACTEAEGPGRRYALWLQGCPLRCPGCCNPHMIPEVEVEWLSVEALAQEICSSPDIEGLTVIGGEPFAQAEALAALAGLVRASGLSVMVFSGYTLAQLSSSPDPSYARLLGEIDLLIDGPYVASKHVTDRRWVGSSNQRARFLTERYAHMEEGRGGWDSSPNTTELRWRGGELIINGFPHPELTALLSQLTPSSARQGGPDE